MFVNINSEAASLQESLCALRFAAKVNACETGAKGGAHRSVSALPASTSAPSHQVLPLPCLTGTEAPRLDMRGIAKFAGHGAAKESLVGTPSRGSLLNFFWTCAISRKLCNTNIICFVQMLWLLCVQLSSVKCEQLGESQIRVIRSLAVFLHTVTPSVSWLMQDGYWHSRKHSALLSHTCVELLSRSSGSKCAGLWLVPRTL